MFGGMIFPNYQLLTVKPYRMLIMLWPCRAGTISCGMIVVSFKFILNKLEHGVSLKRATIILSEDSIIS